MLTLSKRVWLYLPVSQTWALLKDTDQLNKSIGLSPVSFKPDADPKKKGRFNAVTRAFGLTLRYDEYPFEWVEDRYYHVVRKFHDGPISEIVAGIRLKEDGARTELEVYADIEPRNMLGTFVARSLMKRMAVDKVVAYAQESEQRILSTRLARPALKPEVNIRQLTVRMTALKADFPDASADRLEQALLTMSDTEVSRMRPFELADEWKLERFQTLRMFLHAAKAGLVDIVWDILCPHCNTDVEKETHLSDLKPETICSTCDIKFNVDLAKSVEVTFKANAGVRVARRDVYCIGGPANKPQIAVQLRLEPGVSRSEPISFSSESARVRCFPVELAPLVSVQISEGRLSAVNKGPEPVLLVVEKELWRQAAATAALVTSLQDFRDLFPGEAVSPGSEVAIGNIALLFTDLQGSTAFYTMAGDTKAFDFVLGHFRYLVEHVTKNRGGLVKTMGDAIMASFYTGRDAMAAALQMQREWNSFIGGKTLPVTPKLKIGIHQGGAIVINLNGKFDYFGSTVNLAARAEGKSLGSDIVFTAAVAEDPEVEALLKQQGLPPQIFQAELKGLDGPQRLFRVAPGAVDNVKQS